MQMNPYLSLKGECDEDRPEIGLLRAMAGDHGHRPTPRQLLARSERWRPWRAYAALHLWASAVSSNSKADSFGAYNRNLNDRQAA
jgi:hypothetical protein